LIYYFNRNRKENNDVYLSELPARYHHRAADRRLAELFVGRALEHLVLSFPRFSPNGSLAARAVRISRKTAAFLLAGQGGFLFKA
jgi:hypothetical protein